MDTAFVKDALNRAQAAQREINEMGFGPEATIRSASSERPRGAGRVSDRQSVHQMVLETREDDPFIVNVYFDNQKPVEVWVGPADYPENNGDWWWVSPPEFDDDGLAIGASSGDVFSDWSAALCDFVMQAEIDLFHWPKWLDELEKKEQDE